VESTDFDGKYTKFTLRMEIMPNLFIDQSTLINGDFTTKVP